MGLVSQVLLSSTLSQAAVTNRVQRPDILSIDGDVKVLAAGRGQSTGGAMPSGIPARYRRYFRGFRGQAEGVTFLDQKDLKNLKLSGGIGSRTEIEYQLLVEGRGKITVKLDCVKGGTDTKTIDLK